ncbi:hypothetical protein N7468_008414 [Penicillium chermesinum]|uniref:Uncharacterized protein n=1 Tax=Penicillium chermesinum TaxID=63820 RepID=A0A9W9NPP7_9EURO|nr:uncharacterized protein N7468_008414 [Penicillium chermesinum]KAJ5223872.1 hypothetical protein N7468_008414 [Penicillium chermesinum]
MSDVGIHIRHRIDLRTIAAKHFVRPVKSVFPIIFNEGRGWSLVVSTLPFLSFLVVVVCAVFINFANQPRYRQAVKETTAKQSVKLSRPSYGLGLLLSEGAFFLIWLGRSTDILVALLRRCSR